MPGDWRFPTGRLKMPRAKRRKASLQESMKAVPDPVEVSQRVTQEPKSKTETSSFDWSDWKTYAGIALGLGLAFAGGMAYERSQTTY